MNHKAQIIVAVVAMPLLALLVFVVYGYAQQYSAVWFFPRVVPRPYTEMIVCAVLGAVAAGVVAAYPLARIYNRGLFIAALVVAAPVLALRLPEIVQFWAKDDSIVFMSSFEAVVLVSAIVGGAWVARKQMRSNKPLEPTR